MKRILFRTLFLGALLIAAASCNDDDDGGPSTPTPPSYSFTGKVIDLTNGNETEWTATYAEGVLSDEGLMIKATAGGGDTMYLAVPSPNVGANEIDIFSPFADDNAYIEFGSDTTIFGIFDADSEVSLVVTEHNDSTMEITGLVPQVNLFNFVDSTRFLFVEGEFTDLPYTIDIPDIFGDGSFVMTVDGTVIDFPITLGLEFFGQLSISGSTNSGTPQANLSVPADITPGNYTLGGGSGNTMTYTVSQNESYLASSGSLSISSNAGGAIEGTFSFTGQDLQNPGSTINVTNGNFSVEY